jgi:hypothetical protein
MAHQAMPRRRWGEASRTGWLADAAPSRFPPCSAWSARPSASPADDHRRPARPCARAQPLRAHHAAQGDRAPGLRAGGSHPRAGARAGSHPAAPREGLRGGGPRAALPAPGGRGGLLRQLRLPPARDAGAHAPARRARLLVGGAAAAGRVGARVRARARRRASTGGGCGVRARQDAELVRRAEQREHATARRDALPRPPAHRAARERGAHVRGAGADAGAGGSRARRSTRCSISRSPSTPRCRPRRSGGWRAGS